MTDFDLRLRDRLVHLDAAIPDPGPPVVEPLRRPRRWRRRTLVLLAAASLSVGAGGAAGLYDGLGASFEYGFELQLLRSVEIGASDVVDDFRVTIDRVYLDGERLMLAVRVTDEAKRPEVVQLNAMSAIVSDANGTWRGAGIATGQPHGRWAATNVIWRLPPEPAAVRGAPLRLNVVFPYIEWYDSSAVAGDWWKRRQGPWVFDIDVPVEGTADVAVARPDVTVEIRDVPVTLTEVVVGATSIRPTLVARDGAAWWFIGSVRHGERSFPIVGQSAVPGQPFRLSVDGGAGDPSGDWAIEIVRVMRRDASGEETVMDGLWVFPFSIP